MNTSYSEQKPGLVTTIALMTLISGIINLFWGFVCICNCARHDHRRDLPAAYHSSHHSGDLRDHLRRQIVKRPTPTGAAFHFHRGLSDPHLFNG